MERQFATWLVAQEKLPFLLNKKVPLNLAVSCPGRVQNGTIRWDAFGQPPPESGHMLAPSRGSPAPVPGDSPLSRKAVGKE